MWGSSKGMRASRAIRFLVMPGLVGIPFFLVLEDGSDAMRVNG
jgi:hypothetical protein